MTAWRLEFIPLARGECPTEWTDSIGCFPAGPHRCDLTHPYEPQWHCCKCGADIYPPRAEPEPVPVLTADAVLMRPLPPGAGAVVLGHLFNLPADQQRRILDAVALIPDAAFQSGGSR